MHCANCAFWKLKLKVFDSIWTLVLKSLVCNNCNCLIPGHNCAVIVDGVSLEMTELTLGTMATPGISSKWWSRWLGAGTCPSIRNNQMQKVTQIPANTAVSRGQQLTAGFHTTQMVAAPANNCYFWNVTACVSDKVETPGSTFYINKDGNINLAILLQGLHNVSLQDSVCTARVCEVLLYILTTLLDLGLLKSEAKERNVSCGEYWTCFTSCSRLRRLVMLIFCPTTTWPWIL